MGPSVKTGLRLCIVVLMFSIEANAFGSWSSQARLFSDSAAMHTMQAGGDSCLLSGALEACQAARVDKGDRSDYLHICPSDGDSCNPSLCYYSAIPPCCDDEPFAPCNSTSKLLVHGKTFDVTFYDVVQPGVLDRVCFTIQPKLEVCDCEQECDNVEDPCRENAVECNAATAECVCKPNFQPPFCCECVADNETVAYYFNQTSGECKPICRPFCLGFVPNQPCTNCLGGRLPPDCCNCPPGQTIVNDQCKCEGNTDSNGNCLPGYAGPDCCNCVEGLTEINGVCRCEPNTIDVLGTCKAGYAPVDCCECEEGLTEINGECRCRANTIDDLGTCKAGYAPVDCCECEEGLTEINGECRCQANTIDDLGTCKAGYAAVNCCKCEEGLTEINGECRCQANTIDALGTCKAGYAPVDCCECEEGLTEINGECRCASNVVDGECREGYAPVDCCECAEGFQKNDDDECVAPCSRSQNIFFLIDATSSNSLQDFSELIITIQFLVAAFNPTTTGTTNVFGYLFPEGDLIWNSNDACSNIVSTILPQLTDEFRRYCPLGGAPSTAQFPDICGTTTAALPGLRRIAVRAAQLAKPNFPQAVVMVTDGRIEDSEDVPTTISSLSASVTALVAAGIGSDVDEQVLQRYTIGGTENAVTSDSSIELGIRIVRRLEASAVLCNEHANEIVAQLNRVRQQNLFNINRYAACVPNPNCAGITSYVFPTCGGRLEIGYSPPESQQGGGRSSLEDEIIAAVENVLERNMNG